MSRTTSPKFISKSVTPTLTTCMFDSPTSLFQQSPYTYFSGFFLSPPNFSSPSKINSILLPSFFYLQYLLTGHVDAQLLFWNCPMSLLTTLEDYKAIFLATQDFPNKKKINNRESSSKAFKAKLSDDLSK